MVVQIEEFSTLLIYKDELERLNQGLEAKIFINSEEFNLKVIDDNYREV